jgi:hypothetical protein
VTVRTASWVAWSLWALAVVLEVAAIPLWLANHPILLSRFGTAEDFAPHVFLVPAYPARSLHPRRGGRTRLPPREPLAGPLKPPESVSAQSVLVATTSDLLTIGPEQRI